MTGIENRLWEAVAFGIANSCAENIDEMCNLNSFWDTSPERVAIGSKRIHCSIGRRVATTVTRIHKWRSRTTPLHTIYNFFSVNEKHRKRRTISSASTVTVPSWSTVFISPSHRFLVEDSLSCEVIHYQLRKVSDWLTVSSTVTPIRCCTVLLHVIHGWHWSTTVLPFLWEMLVVNMLSKDD